MTTSALSTALSGLRVTQRSLGVTADNVANASTDGFTRKTLSQSSVIIDGEGAGVKVNQVDRFVDQSLLRDFRRQVSVENFLSTKENFLERIVSVHGNPELENNISGTLSRLRDKFIELTGSPESTALQSDIVASAEKSANTINRLSDFILDIRQQVQKEINLATTDINSSLKTIAVFNTRIVHNKNVGKSVAALEDQRDLAIKELSEFMDISFFTNNKGAVIVQSVDGRILADLKPRPFSFDNTPLSFNSEHPSNLPGVILDEGEASEFDFASKPPGGKLGALLELRDQDLIRYQSHIDELAHKTAQRFDAQGLTLFVDSNTGVVPPDDPQQYVGFGSRITVNPAVIDDPSLIQQGTGAPVSAGSTAVIERIIDFTFGDFADGVGTPHPDFRIDNLGPFGNQNLNIPKPTSNPQLESVFTRDVEQRLLDQSAVNTDEEMAKLIELEQAFAASSQVIQTLDDMFNQLLNAI